MSKSLEAMTFDSGYTHGHKAGWLQAKANIIELLTFDPIEPHTDAVIRSCMRAIASMEYKEPTNV